MPISQTPELLREVLNGEPIPIQKQAYFRRRFRLRVYEAVFGAFHTAETMSKADLARRIGRRPEVISRLLGAPGNLTLDTASDLLLAMGAELRVSVHHFVPLVEDATNNLAAQVVTGQQRRDNRLPPAWKPSKDTHSLPR
jgi:plasmid maintenance system antidote protein VapI